MSSKPIDMAKALLKHLQENPKDIEQLTKKEQPAAEVRQEPTAQDLIKASGWPDARRPALLVGHQPTLGEAASLLLGGRAASWRFAKGAVWWLRSRERKGRVEAVLLLAIEPEMLR